MFVKVECSAEPGREAEPRRFTLGTRSVEVQCTMDRWLAADHGYYKVRGNDGAIYILRNDVGSNTWQLWMYDTIADIDRER